MENKRQDTAIETKKQRKKEEDKNRDRMKMTFKLKC